MHIAVRLMQLFPDKRLGHMIAEPQKIEGLCEAGALLCLLHLSQARPDIYKRDCIAYLYHNRNEAACNVAEEEAPSLYPSVARLEGQVYGCGMQRALRQVLQASSSSSTGGSFADIARAFLASSHIPS